MLPAEIAKQVKRIQLETGRQVTDVLGGAYHSVFKGRGMEFDEVRPYVPGDDIRTIDWNVTARTGEPHVKRYVEERELTVMLLVDVSASQDFGSAHRSKREAAVELSALIAFSAIRNNDKVGLLLFHGEAEEYIPPRKGQKHGQLVLREVLARGRVEGQEGEPARGGFNPLHVPRAVLRRFRKLRAKTRKEPRRGTNIGHALEFCRRVLPRRVVLFLISDFIDEGYLDVLRSANRRHDVVAVLVTDGRELEFASAGLLTLQDAETGRTRLVDTKSSAFRDEVSRVTAERIERLASELRSTRIDLMQIDATRPTIDPLLEFLRMRRRRLRR